MERSPAPGTPADLAAPVAPSRTPAARRRAHTTIVDVAAAAGVSRQTVSRALNNMPGILPETRARVLAVCAELGYRPSRFARNIARERVPALGLVVPSLYNPYFTDLAAAVVEAAQTADWRVMVTVVGPGDAGLAGLRDLARQVDVVVGYLGATQEVLVEEMAGQPLILLERTLVDPPPTVRGIGVDIAAGVRRGVDHLVARGHRVLGLLDDGEAPGTPRQAAFRAGLAAHGLPDDASQVAYGSQTLAGGAAAFEELLTRRPDVTAVLAFNDYMAIGALQAARGLGIRVPEDCAVLGFDGLQLATATAPPLSTVAIDRQEVARRVLRAAQELVAGPGAPTPADDGPVVPEVVARAST